MAKANQDVRDYMADHGVTQRDLAAQVGVSQFSISKALSKELSQKDKEMYLNMIDAIVADREEPQCEASEVDEDPVEETIPVEDTSVETEEVEEEIEEEIEEEEETYADTKFQVGDRVIIPSKNNKVGIVSDIWSSQVKSIVMYAVENQDDGYCGMYSEHQLELEPLPIKYTFETVIDGNVAVVAMHATQGDKTWVYARGHAHIIHDRPVGMAQAISYASKRMFESLDKKQTNKIYFK